MATLYGVIYTDDSDAETDHSAHLTSDDAARAGAELARREWDRMTAHEPAEEREPFPEVDDDWDAIDALRSNFSVRLEVESVEIGDDVIAALFARLAVTPT